MNIASTLSHATQAANSIDCGGEPAFRSRKPATGSLPVPVDEEAAIADLSPEGRKAASGYCAKKEEVSGTNEPAKNKQIQQDEKRIAELKKRDREVREHEQAHLSAAGSLASGGASLTYETGPDGKQYATGGEVSIDASPGRTPEETVGKAKTVRRAALAPRDPSPQDRKIAAAASQMEARAHAELAAEQRSNTADETQAAPPEHEPNAVDITAAASEPVQAPQHTASAEPPASPARSTPQASYAKLRDPRELRPQINISA